MRDREAPLPASSVWPFVLAGGLTLLALGVLTSYAFSVLGALLVAVSLGGWIGELRREHE